jgi:formyltetrahydrofolate-dependent phosphoribosylglycinamide formyltransferase
MHSPLRLVVLISGGGTTLRNLLQKVNEGSLQAQVSLVISSAPEARGLMYAREAGIPTAIVERKNFATGAEFSQAIFEHCRQADPQFVVMGGFLKLVEIPTDFENRVINIHPALIPAFCGHGFYGRRVHAAVLESGVKITGCTVHFVDNEYDHGPIILQKSVPVQDDDTPETLALRVFHAECEAYPEAIELLRTGRVRVEGRRVHIDQNASS